MRQKVLWFAAVTVAVLAGIALLAIPPAKGRGFTPRNAAAAPVLPARPLRPLRVLVIGGTSGIGLQTVRLALERGHEVTALARRAPSQPLHSAHLRYLQGDITDAPTMATAVAGQDVVVTSIGAAPGRDPVTVFSSGTRTVIAAMQSNGVSRLIAITGIGAGESRGHGGFFYDRVIMPLVLRRVYEDKEREESIIRGSAVDWTIVRPGFLTRGPATHAYQVARGLEGVRSGSITRADVAEFVVAAAESGQHVRETLLLSN